MSGLTSHAREIQTIRTVGRTNIYIDIKTTPEKKQQQRTETPAGPTCVITTILHA